MTSEEQLVAARRAVVPLKLGQWASKRFRRGSIPTIAGISGGSTSGMMAALCVPSIVLSFQNTGREAARTYDFLGELADAIERPITWLEFRPPEVKGDQPCKSRVEVVTYQTADRSGGPFEMMMSTLNAFRARHGKGPIAPWWKSRICTTYMKTRTARNWVAAQGWRAWNEFVGLRADEPSRVEKLRVGVPRKIGRFAPLSDAGISKADVDAFWGEQAFSLGLDPLMGNCTGCFLKDQADLSRALAQPETDVMWWHRMATLYPGWGGINFAGYRRLVSEAPARRRIEAALRAGEAPAEDRGIPDARRFKLVVIQERKRLAGQTAFSCNCEGSEAMALFDEEEEERYILSLPEAAGS